MSLGGKPAAELDAAIGATLSVDEGTDPRVFFNVLEFAGMFGAEIDRVRIKRKKRMAGDGTGREKANTGRRKAKEGKGKAKGQKSNTKAKEYPRRGVTTT